MTDVAVGSTASYAVTNELTIRVEIRDQRIVYGRREYLVTPVDGSGESWVYGSNVRID